MSLSLPMGLGGWGVGLGGLGIREAVLIFTVSTLLSHGTCSCVKLAKEAC